MLTMLACSSLYGFADTPRVSEDITRLCSSNVSVMLDAGNQICVQEAVAVPDLIRLLEVDQRIVPINKPGEGGSYLGHGACSGCNFFIFYGLNEIQVRAGWLLERITFQDFGFSGGSDLEHTAEERHVSVALAKAWWSRKNDDWLRIDGIQEALSSDHIDVQKGALRYLLQKEVDGPCNGLDQSSYYQKLHPVVLALLNSPNPEIRNEAATLWTRTELRGKSDSQHLFLSNLALADGAKVTYQLNENKLSRDGRIIAQTGDSFQSIVSQIPLAAEQFFGDEAPTLDTIPPLAVEVKDGKAVAWIPLDDRDAPLPWLRRDPR